MPNDVLIYDDINSYTASEFIEDVCELEILGVTELTARVNTDGGDPRSMWGMVAKFIEFAGKKIVKVDGKAYSAGLFFLCYCDDSECLDISEGLVHRAAYSQWFESQPDLFTQDLRDSLVDLNKKLEAAFRNSIDVEAFENLKQCKDKAITIKDIFSMDSRIDVRLSAKDMKKIGLVKRIVTITPAVQKQIQEASAKKLEKITARYTATATTVKPIEEPKKNKVMTLAELKIAHPDVYAQAVQAGVEIERERVEGILVFNDVAPRICAEAVASGKNLTEKQKNEIFMAQMKTNALGALQQEAPAAVATSEPEVVKKETTPAVEAKKKALDSFENEVLAGFDIK